MRLTRSAARTAVVLCVAYVAFFGLASHAQVQQLGPAATTVVNDAGDLAFISAGGAVVVLQRAGGDAVAVLRSGDAVPGHDGSRVVRVTELKLNAPGLVAFTAEFWGADGTLKRAILSFDGTTLRTIVDSDDLAAAAGVAGVPAGLPLTLLGLDDAGGIVVEGPGRFVVSSAGAIYQLPAPSATPAAPRPAVPISNIIQNPGFSQGTGNLAFWQIHATPTQSYIHVDASSQVLNFYRDAYPPDNANQATVFQQTGVGFPQGARIEAQFKLGNSSTVRKRLKVLIVDSDFSDITACSFELDALTGLQTYAMFTHTSKAWTNATMYFYAGNVGSDSGAYQIDDVQMGASGTASTARTDCVDPTAPGPTAGIDGSDLIENGDFSAFHAQWGTDGPIETDASTTVMQFRRLATTPPPAVVLHTTNEPIADNAIVTATFQLGNSSLAVPQRVVVLIHDGDFSDILTCTFNLPANRALQPYVIRSFTTKAWTNATFSLYPREGHAQWILADNITLKTTPSAAIVGTECIEPTGLAPVVTSGANLSYTEGDPATVIDPLLTVTDADSPELVSATITISANYQAGADVLAFIPGGGMGDIAFGSYVGGVLTLTSPTGATPAEWQTALRAVTYANTSQAPSPLARTISWQVSDGGTFSNIATSTISVVAVNDPPVNTIPAGTPSTPGNTDLTGLVFSVADADLAGADLLATITVTNGVISLASTTGLSFTTGDGSLDASLVFTGTLTNVNTALNGVTFRPTNGYSGPASIQIVMNDQGATPPPAQQDDDTLNITVLNPPPNAVTDTYQTIGNTELRVGLAVGTTPNVASAGNVLTNDTDPDAPLSVTGIVGCGDVAAPFDCTIAGPTGGTVSMNSDGTFSFVPGAGNTSGTFQYVVTDSHAAPASSNGTVNITIVQRVWYVKNTAAIDGTGRSTDPFDTLAEAQAAATNAGDYIFVFFGNGSTLGQNAGIVLKTNQHLLGQFAGLSIPVSVNGGPNPTVLVAAGDVTCGGPCQPWISNVGDVVTNVSASHQIPAEIAGLDLNSTSGNAIDVTTSGAITGSSLAIRSNYIRNAGAESIDINRNAGSSGNLALAITDNAWGGGGSYVGNAIDVVSAAGTGLTVNVTRNTNVKSNATAILINGDSTTNTTANTTLVGLFSNTIDPATGGTGLQITNARIDADAVTAGFQQVVGGTTVIGTSGDGVGGAGLVLGTAGNTVIGDLAFTNLSVFLSGGGAGIAVTSAGAFNGTTTGMQLVATNPVETTATGGPALDLNAVTINLTLNNISSTNSGTQGVQMTSVAGSLTVSGTTTVTNSVTQGVLISGSSVTASFGNTTITSGTDSVSLQNNATGTRTFGTLQTTGGTGAGFLHSINGGVTNVTGAATFTNPGSTGISIQNSTTAVTFAGTTIDKAATAGTGVDLVSNSATISFGSLGITTSNGTGLLATNNTGNLVNLNSAAQSIAATGGPAINLTGTSAGSLTPINLNFTNVSSTSSTGTGLTLSFASNVGGGNGFTAAGGTITGPAGIAFLANGGTSIINYPGSLSKINAGSLVQILDRAAGASNVTLGGNLVCAGLCGDSTGGAPGTGAIKVTGNVSGAIDFTGASKVINTATLMAVNLASNTGATINFRNGGLDIDVTTGVGFVVSGGGTVSVLTDAGAANTINSTTGQALSLSSASGTITINASTIASTTGVTVNVDAGTPTLVVNAPITNTGGRLVNVQSTTSGSATFNGAVSSNGTGSTGIRIFSANSNVSFTAGLALGTSGGNLTSQAITIANGNGTATYALGAVNITTTNAVGLGATDFDGTLTSTSGTFSTGTATAISIDGPGGNTNLSMTLTSVTKTGTSTGILLRETVGSITVNGGALTSSGAGNRTIDFAANNNGTYDFADVTLNGNSSDGIDLVSTDLGTYTFGDLDVNTPANGIGVSVNGTSAAVTFRSVDMNGSNCACTGILLTSTTGSFTVTGDGTNTTLGGNASGGTIQNMTGADGATTGNGIYMDNVTNITLRRLTINGTNQNHGIRGFRVNNFTLEYSTVNGTMGDSAAFDNYGEGSVMFGDDASAATNGMTGVGTVTSSSFAGGRARNFSVVNTAGTLNRLTITNSFFGHNQNGNASSSFESRNAGTVMNVTVTGSTFTGSPGDAANFTSQTGTTMDVIFGGVTGTRGTAPGNTITNNHPNNNTGGSNLTFATQGAMTFHCLGNLMSGANGSAVTFFKASAGTSMQGFFDNNEIGTNGVAGSGSLTANGIFVSAAGTGTMSYTVTNNIIRRVNGNFHISADNTGGSYAANFDIRGNTFDQPGPTLAGAIGMTNGSPGSGDTVNVCAVIGGAAAGNKNAIGGFAGGQQTIFLGSSGANNSATHIFNLPGLATFTEAGVEGFVAGNNTMGGSVVDAFADAPATFAAFKGNAGCGTPTSSPSPIGGVARSASPSATMLALLTESAVRATPAGPRRPQRVEDRLLRGSDELSDSGFNALAWLFALAFVGAPQIVARRRRSTFYLQASKGR